MQILPYTTSVTELQIGVASSKWKSVTSSANGFLFTQAVGTHFLMYTDNIGLISTDKVWFSCLELGFFGFSTSSKTSVSDPLAITTTDTAPALYTGGTPVGAGQRMLDDLKTDVTNLRTTLLNLTNALQSYNLV